MSAPNPASVHRVETRHIRRLVNQAATLAVVVDGLPAGELVQAPDATRLHGDGRVPIDHALARAANLLRHAAEELEDERMACLGWASP